MCQVERAGVRNSVYVAMSTVGDDDLGDRVAKIVAIVAGDAVGFGFIPPEDDHTVVLVCVGGHDGGNDLAEEVVALLDIGGIAGETFVAAAQSGVHVVELVRRNPVVVGHGVVVQINEQLLQRGVLFGQRIGSR